MMNKSKMWIAYRKFNIIDSISKISMHMEAKKMMKDRSRFACETKAMF
jgi:hypothetical protein